MTHKMAKDKKLTIRVTDKELQQLKTIAQVHDTTMTELVRNTLIATLKFNQ